MKPLLRFSFYATCCVERILFHVILSEVAASHCEAAAQSKDPYDLPRTRRSGHFSKFLALLQRPR